MKPGIKDIGKCVVKTKSNSGRPWDSCYLYIVDVGTKYVIGQVYDQKSDRPIMGADQNHELEGDWDYYKGDRGIYFYKDMEKQKEELQIMQIFKEMAKAIEN